MSGAIEVSARFVPRADADAGQIAAIAANLTEHSMSTTAGDGGVFLLAASFASRARFEEALVATGPLFGDLEKLCTLHDLRFTGLPADMHLAFDAFEPEYG